VGELDGKVALVTGAARGLGRAYALRLAEGGADVVLVDACRQMDTPVYALATPEDLAEAKGQIEDSTGRRVLAFEADVKDLAALEEVVASATAELAGVDIVVANAGIVTNAPILEFTHEQWAELLDVNLNGMWRTVKATVPGMIERDRGGVIIMSGATAGFKGMPLMPHYNAAKYGMVGLCKSLALDLGPHFIRANIVHPTSVDTPLLQSWLDTSALDPEADSPLKDLNVLPRGWFEGADAADIVAWLASDRARWITGLSMPCGQRF
jgi:SDR family mycofactocin-dependent oxidoreductase